jgi:hypothetical protein
VLPTATRQINTPVFKTVFKLTTDFILPNKCSKLIVSQTKGGKAMVVDEHVAAKELGTSVSTLRNWRFQRKGVPYIKMGKSVRYDLDAIKRYIDDHTIATEKTTMGSRRIR